MCQSEKERQRIWPFNNATLFSPSHAIQLSWLVCCILSGPCRGWGRCSPASHRGGLAQSVWDLWWIKWHWDRFFFEFISFPLSVLFHCGSPYTYITYLGDEQFRDIVSSRWHKLDHAFCASVFLYVRALYWWYISLLVFETLYLAFYLLFSEQWDWASLIKALLKITLEKLLCCKLCLLLIRNTNYLVSPLKGMESECY
jgi:hypothetical protein